MSKKSSSPIDMFLGEGLQDNCYWWELCCLGKEPYGDLVILEKPTTLKRENKEKQQSD